MDLKRSLSLVFLSNNTIWNSYKYTTFISILAGRPYLLILLHLFFIIVVKKNSSFYILTLIFNMCHWVQNSYRKNLIMFYDIFVHRWGPGITKRCCFKRWDRRTHTQSFDLVYAKSFIRRYRLSKTLNVRTLLLSLVSITYGIKTVINMALLLAFLIVT